eukprot:1159477-Pelagomonas_calceolata.AAC.3
MGSRSSTLCNFSCHTGNSNGRWQWSKPVGASITLYTNLGHAFVPGRQVCSVAGAVVVVLAAAAAAAAAVFQGSC